MPLQHRLPRVLSGPDLLYLSLPGFSPIALALPGPEAGSNAPPENSVHATGGDPFQRFTVQTLHQNSRLAFFLLKGAALDDPIRLTRVLKLRVVPSGWDGVVFHLAGAAH